jgi:DNA polymerase III delta subunit
VLLTFAFTAVLKLKDSSLDSYKPYELKFKLKLWYNFEQMLPVYRNFARQIDISKASSAISLIYETDKLFKTSNADKRSHFVSLINFLTGI